MNKHNRREKKTRNVIFVASSKQKRIPAGAAAKVVCRWVGRSTKVQGARGAWVHAGHGTSIVDLRSGAVNSLRPRPPVDTLS